VDHPRTITCSGAFELPVAAEAAGELFTPEGERAWAEDWDPRYPDRGSDAVEPGTVFVTDRQDSEAVWVITAAGEGTISYARFDPLGVMGTIEVAWEAVSPERTRVEVVYRSTATDESMRPQLGAFAAHYDAYMEHWRQAIVDSLGE
jgi:hypothetical protein